MQSNKIIFVIGFIAAVFGAFLLFDTGNLLGEDTSNIGWFIGFIGVLMIAVSGGIWGRKR
jgi:hypothetical protein